MISGLTCKFLGVLFSPGVKVWLFAGGTGYFSSMMLLSSPSRRELNPALHLVLSQQEHKWDFPCKTACLQDGAETGNGEMEPFPFPLPESRHGNFGLSRKRPHLLQSCPWVLGTRQAKSTR